MDTEADGTSIETTEVEAAAEPAQEPASEADFSVADAFAEARAELDAAPKTPDAPEAPEGEAAAEPTAETAKAPEPEPVTPEPQKTAAQIREEARQELLKEQAAEKRYLENYLELETERQVDPEGFNEKMLGDENLYGFYRAYRAAHPEVTLENPNPGPKQATPDEIRAEIRQSYNEGLQAILTDVAGRSGVDYKALPGVAEGKLGTAIDSLIAKGVEAGVARELPKAVAKEREAIRVELQAEYANKTIVTPRVIGGSPAGAPKAKEGAIDFREAMALAKAELEVAS